MDGRVRSARVRHATSRHVGEGRESFVVPKPESAMQANVSVVMPQVIDGLKQRMAGLHVRGTMAPGHLVFSVIDFLQQARTDCAGDGDATRLFGVLEERWGEDFTRHVFMVKLRRKDTDHTPTMTLHALHTLLPLLGDKVQPEFRRSFEEIYPHPAS